VGGHEGLSIGSERGELRLKAMSMDGRSLGGDKERSGWGGQGPMHVQEIGGGICL
jgi:hypothetical protein